MPPSHCAWRGTAMIRACDQQDAVVACMDSMRVQQTNSFPPCICSLTQQPLCVAVAVLPSPMCCVPHDAMCDDTQLEACSELLRCAKHLAHTRRLDIRQRQKALLAAQAEWRSALAAAARGSSANNSADGGGAELRLLKRELQQQIHQLNQETRGVKALRMHAARLETRLVQQQQLRGNGAGCARAVSAAALQSRLLQQQEQADPDEPHRHTAVTHTVAQQQQQHGMPPPCSESSLDRVAVVLQHALQSAAAAPTTCSVGAGAAARHPPSGSVHGCSSSSAVGGGGGGDEVRDCCGCT